MECRNPNIRNRENTKIWTDDRSVPRGLDLGHSGPFEQLELIWTKKAAKLDCLICKKLYIKWSSLVKKLWIFDVRAVRTKVRSIVWMPKIWTKSFGFWTFWTFEVIRISTLYFKCNTIYRKCPKFELVRFMDSSDFGETLVVLFLCMYFIKD